MTETDPRLTIGDRCSRIFCIAEFALEGFSVEQFIHLLVFLFHVACACVVYGFKKGEIVAHCRATKAAFTRIEEMICIFWLLLVTLASYATIIGPLAILGIVLIPMQELHWAWTTPPELRPDDDSLPPAS